MKKMLILFLAISLFTACNNSDKGLSEKDDRKTDKRDKDDREDGGDDDDRNADDRNEKKSGGSWSKKERNKFLGDCEDQLTGQGYANGQARQLCDCVLGKVERKYSSLEDADERGGAAAGEKAMIDCMGGGGFKGDDGGGGDYDDN